MRPLGITLAILLVVLVVLAMVRGWRGRAVRSAAVLDAPPAVPADLGAARLAPVAATYVSTTTAGDWLDRVVAHDLGVRSAATVRVHDAGVHVERRGARDLFVPVAALVAVERTPGMAGKFVGGDGLVVLRWRGTGRDGPVELDTGLRTRRARDRTALDAALAGLLPGATPPPSHPASEEQA